MAEMELLAPAGTLETFHAAVNGGADAVYVGAPGFNARNLARDLRLEEIGAMIEHCHGLGRKFYVAANSLILERELPQVIDHLAVIQELRPDGLIVQDLGLIRLVKNHFPQLTLHGSTLTTVHNSDGVRFQAALGCDRVVLARELTLKEISSIAARRGKTELEIFIHGAMCFSYSGLCLFSSYLGGKSGLRGRCVQPCRRGYTTAPKESGARGRKAESSRYLFSMNDLSGLEAVPFLQEIGISSLKIEGRLRSPHYVESIVAAYRMVLDAAPGDDGKALAGARRLVDQAMSRKTSGGYFFSPQPQEAITPHHSGNLGTHLGRFSATRTVGDQVTCRFVTKAGLAIGDRLRLHVEPSGERTAFRLKSLFAAGAAKPRVEAGVKVSIALPTGFQPGTGGHVEVYRVDAADGSQADGQQRLETGKQAKQIGAARKRLAARIDAITARVCSPENLGDQTSGVAGEKIRQSPRLRSARKRLPLEWWLKTDSIKTLLGDLPLAPDRYLLNFDRQTINQTGRIKTSLGKRSRMVTWALPPVIMENDLPRYRKQIDQLLRSGFRSFQLGHISQLLLFEGEKAHLFGDYTMNLLNNQAVAMFAEVGGDAAQTSIEIDRRALHELLAGCRAHGKNESADRGGRRIPLGMTVYGAPPLYTARLAPKHFQFDRPIYSPKNEPYVIKKKEGFTQTFPEQPFSLLPYLDELKGMGVNYVIVDISGRNVGKRELGELSERLNNSGRYAKLSTFNYLGKLE